MITQRCEWNGGLDGIAVGVYGASRVDHQVDGQIRIDSTLCKDPVSLNAGGMIAGLKAAGVTALKIEGRQRGKGYVTEVVRTFRKAVDAIEQGGDEVEINRILAGQSEGGRQTTGAYKKTWR